MTSGAGAAGAGAPPAARIGRLGRIGRMADRLLPPLLYLGAVVMINAASSTLFVQADLTEGRVHSLAPESVAAVSRLREPLTIRAFFSTDLQAPFNNIERAVRDLFDSYARHGGEFFNATFHTIGDGPDAPAAERMARDYLIYPIQVEQVDRTEVAVRSVYSGLALVHGDLVETIGAITTPDGLEIRITEAIGRLTGRISALLALEEDIAVRLYFSGEIASLGPGMAGLPAAVAGIVAELNGSYFDRLDFTAVDPSATPLDPRDAVRLQLTPLAFRTADGTERAAYAGIVMSSGGATLTLNLIEVTPQGARVADAETIRRSVDNTLKGLLGSQPELGYLAGFGTPPYRGNLTQGRQPTMVDLADLYALLSPDYRYRGLLLEDREIPPDLRTLLVVSPQEPLTEWALFQIDQHLMRGGAVAAFLDTHSIFTNASPLGGASMLSIPRQTGLEDLFAHYGVRVLPRYVLDDEQAYVQRQPNERGGVIESRLTFVPVLRRAEIDTSWLPLQRLDDILVMNASPLELTGAQPGARYVEALRSSATSWQVPGRTDLIDAAATAPPPGDRRGASLLAVYAEGPFTSYFADRTPPARPAGGEQEETGTLIGGGAVQAAPAVAPESAPGARLFVIGASTILGNGFIDARQPGPNTVLIHNLIDYLSGQEYRAALRGRGAVVRRLGEFSQDTQSAVKTFLIAGPPALAALAGAALWLWWRLRQRGIQARFGAPDAAGAGVAGGRGAAPAGRT